MSDEIDFGPIKTKKILLEYVVEREPELANEIFGLAAMKEILPSYSTIKRQLDILIVNAIKKSSYSSFMSIPKEMTSSRKFNKMVTKQEQKYNDAVKKEKLDEVFSASSEVKFYMSLAAHKQGIMPGSRKPGSHDEFSVIAEEFYQTYIKGLIEYGNGAMWNGANVKNIVKNFKRALKGAEVKKYESSLSK